MLRGDLLRLDNTQCVDNYGKTFQTVHGSLVLMANDGNQTGFPLPHQVPVFDPDEPEQYGRQLPYSWVLNHPTNADNLSVVYRRMPDWKVRNYDIDHCLAEMAPQECKLEYSLPLAVGVIIANCVKVLLLTGIPVFISDTPLLTMGDAVSSFLTKPDKSTKGQCLLSLEEVEQPDGVPLRYRKECRFWASGVSKLRWATCFLA